MEKGDECRIGMAYISSAASIRKFIPSGEIELYFLPGTPPSLFGFLLTHNTPLVEAMQQYFSAGDPLNAYFKLVEKYVRLHRSSKKFFRKSGSPQKTKPFVLTDIYESFQALGSGLLAAFVCIILELSTRKCFV